MTDERVHWMVFVWPQRANEQIKVDLGRRIDAQAATMQALKAMLYGP